MNDTCSHYVNLGCPGLATLATQCAAKPCAGRECCPRHQQAWDRPRARRYRTISTKLWRALAYQRRVDLTKFVTANPIASADQRWKVAVVPLKIDAVLAGARGARHALPPEPRKQCLEEIEDKAPR